MNLAPSHHDRRGSTLMVVFVLCSATLLVLGSVLTWAKTNTTLTGRNNEYYRTVSVAEAATEKVVTSILKDYKASGDALVLANIAAYSSLVPTYTEEAQFANYRFSDGQGSVGKTYVASMASTEFRVLTAQYKGLRGYSTPIRIVSNAQQQNSPYQITVGVRQEIEATTIPLFQFAIFYNIDLEIAPGADMDVTGPVYGNENIYISPGASLTFHDDVKSAATIYMNRKPGDPTDPGGGTTTFQGQDASGEGVLAVPVGTNNSAAAVHQIVEVPPAGETSSSQVYAQRLYNKADMIIRVTGNAANQVTITSGVRNSQAITVPSQQWDNTQNSLGFLKQTSFFNKRENKTVNSVEIDVSKLRRWSAATTNALASTLTAGDVQIIYVDDQRTTTTTTEPGVRLVNGAALPSKGLTLATADPIYIKGDYNTSDTSGHVSTGADTTYAKPAALIGDSITILSAGWSDLNAINLLALRIANDTTVNAALLAGIVPTVSGSYSGGVENFPRFLEDWSGKTLTYNGSMVVMYPSRITTGNWGGTGTLYDIYNPPNRNWAFDTNFRDVTKLPPGTPTARGIIRSTWAMVKPNTITAATSQ